MGFGILLSTITPPQSPRTKPQRGSRSYKPAPQIYAGDYAQQQRFFFQLLWASRLAINLNIFFILQNLKLNKYSFTNTISLLQKMLTNRKSFINLQKDFYARNKSLLWNNCLHVF